MALPPSFPTVHSAMAIKEELQEDVKEDGGGKDQLEALDALEKEAAEFNQVRPYSPPY